MAKRTAKFPPPIKPTKPVGGAADETAATEAAQEAASTATASPAAGATQVISTELLIDEMSPIASLGVPPGMPPNIMNKTDEYKVGHQSPPLFLVALYIMVIIWAAISWIPFYGY